ncbi:MAG: DUF89 family protein [Nitrospirae bacterium]|nr:MAG: DUF89 family protein [Nitrospirota bacterium]
MEELKVQLECIPCFFRQVVIALEPNGLTREEALEVARQCVRTAAELPWDRTPAHTTTFVHRKIIELLDRDPFEERKRRYNRLALELYPLLKQKVDNAPEPLEMALKVAVAGNVIDFGIFTERQIEALLDRALDEPLYRFDLEGVRKALQNSDQVLYLLDNAGEVVFDRVLIEVLRDMSKEVTAVVKAEPVLNDATLEDALEAGLTEICTVIDNGSYGIGTILEWCSEEFRKLFYSSPVVISKGQGNLETLFAEKREIFFLFQVKCEVVSRYLGVPKGQRLVLHKKEAP